MEHIPADPNRPDLQREMWVYSGSEVNPENLQLGFREGLRTLLHGPDVLLRIQIVPDVNAPKQLVNRYRGRQLDPDEEEEIEGDDDAEDYSIYVSGRVERRRVINDVSGQHIVFPRTEGLCEKWLGWPKGSIAAVLSIAIAEAR